MFIKGALLYPNPVETISIPKISPAALTIALPVAPLPPPPPQKLILGGPQRIGPTLQASFAPTIIELMSRLKLKLLGSTIEVAEDISDFAALVILPISNERPGAGAPSSGLHSVTSAHSALASHERKSKSDVIASSIESINPLIAEIAPRTAFNIPLTAANI